MVATAGEEAVTAGEETVTRRRLPPARRRLPPAKRRLPPARRRLPPARRRLPPARRRLSPARTHPAQPGDAKVEELAPVDPCARTSERPHEDAGPSPRFQEKADCPAPPPMSRRSLGETWRVSCGDLRFPWL